MICNTNVALHVVTYFWIVISSFVIRGNRKCYRWLICPNCCCTQYKNLRLFPSMAPSCSIGKISSKQTNMQARKQTNKFRYKKGFRVIKTDNIPSYLAFFYKIFWSGQYGEISSSWKFELLKVQESLHNLPISLINCFTISPPVHNEQIYIYE